MQGRDEMIRVGAGRVPNAEVVNEKAEYYAASVVSPEAMRQWARCISVRPEKCNELFVVNAAGLR
jgi:hypothetical protein